MLQILVQGRIHSECPVLRFWIPSHRILGLKLSVSAATSPSNQASVTSALKDDFKIIKRATARASEDASATEVENKIHKFRKWRLRRVWRKNFQILRFLHTLNSLTVNFATMACPAGCCKFEMMTGYRHNMFSAMESVRCGFHQWGAYSAPMFDKEGGTGHGMLIARGMGFELTIRGIWSQREKDRLEAYLAERISR